MKTDMIIGMTVWGNRVSPVFDSSNKLLVATTCQAVVIKRSILEFEPGNEKAMIKMLARLRVEILICGAITDDQTQVLVKQGIRVIPFMTGQVGDILDTCIRNPEQLNRHLMPGAKGYRDSISYNSFR